MTWTPIKAAGAILAVFGLVAAIILYEVAIWRECIADHSWWFCLRIVGR